MAFDLSTAQIVEDGLPGDAMVPTDVQPKQAQIQPQSGFDLSTAQPVDSPEFGVMSVLEPAATMVTGAIAEPVAGVGGVGGALLPGEEGQGAEAVEATREAMTYSPRTKAGQAGLEAIASAAEPITGAISEIEDSIGDFVFDLTGSPMAAAAAKTAPTAGIELLGLGVLNRVRRGTKLLDESGRPTKELRKALDKEGLVFENLSPEAKELIPARATKNIIPGKTEVAGEAEKALISQIQSGAKDDSLAGFTVRGKGEKARIAPDKIAQETLRQGFDPGFVQSVKTATPETRREMAKMLSTMRRIKGNRRLGLDMRPTDITGNALGRRIRFIRDKANQASNELNQIARNKLRGLEVDGSQVVNQLGDSLDQLDVDLMLDASGVPKPSFKGSMIAKDRTSQRIIKDLIDLMAEGGQPDGLRMHKLKRQLDAMIDFRKKSAGGLTDAGRNVLKDVRHSINQTLRAADPDYARVNDTLSTALTAIDDFQDVSGKSIDIFGAGSNKAIGQDARGLMSNRKTRVKLENAIDKLDSAAAELGGNFKENIKDLAMFANSIEDKFGAVAQTSFKGEIESAIKQTAEQGAQETLRQAAIKKAGSAADKLRGINEFNAFESMFDLLRRNQ